MSLTVPTQEAFLFNPDRFIADLEIIQQDSETKVQGVFQNNSNEAVKFVYRITLHKRGKSGRSSSSQGGLFEAAPGERKPLSLIHLDLEENDTYSINLQIFFGQEIIAEKFMSSTFRA